MRRMSKGNIEAWKRRKIVWERRQRGETQRAIAEDLGISVGRVADIERYWADALEAWETGDHPWYIYLQEELVRAGVLLPKRSVVYGYA